MQSHVLVLGLSDGCVVRWALDGSREPEGESLSFVFIHMYASVYSSGSLIWRSSEQAVNIRFMYIYIQ